MPWSETSPMEQRLELIREYETGLWTMTELASGYGVVARPRTSGSTTIAPRARPA